MLICDKYKGENSWKYPNEHCQRLLSEQSLVLPEGDRKAYYHTCPIWINAEKESRKNEPRPSQSLVEEAVCVCYQEQWATLLPWHAAHQTAVLLVAWIGRQIKRGTNVACWILTKQHSVSGHQPKCLCLYSQNEQHQWRQAMYLSKHQLVPMSVIRLLRTSIRRKQIKWG